MYSFKDRALIPNVPGRCETQPTNQAGAHVREDVAIKVGHDEHFVAVGLRIGDDFQTGIIQQLGVEFDRREIPGNVSRRTEEQAVTHLHDCGFMHGPYLPLANVLGVLEREFEYPLRGSLGDELDTLHYAIDDDVLDT